MSRVKQACRQETLLWAWVKVSSNLAMWEKHPGNLWYFYRRYLEDNDRNHQRTFAVIVPRSPIFAIVMTLIGAILRTNIKMNKALLVKSHEWCIVGKYMYVNKRYIFSFVKYVRVGQMHGLAREDYIIFGSMPTPVLHNLPRSIGILGYSTY